jgi:transcriptional regulator with XRE-family HTH domain
MDISSWKEKIEWRRNNKSWLNKSTEISLIILESLESLNWTKEDFANKLEISIQEVNSYLKGQKNFSIEDLSKLEKVLGISFILFQPKK